MKLQRTSSDRNSLGTVLGTKILAVWCSPIVKLSFKKYFAATKSLVMKETRDVMIFLYWKKISKWLIFIVKFVQFTEKNILHKELNNFFTAFILPNKIHRFCNDHYFFTKNLLLTQHIFNIAVLCIALTLVKGDYRQSKLCTILSEARLCKFPLPLLFLTL